MTYRSRHRARRRWLPPAASAAVAAVAKEPLYRGSALLMINTALQGAFGFAFWAAAARFFNAADIGVLAVVTAAVNLLGVVSAVGIPNLMTRDLAATTAQRDLVARGAAVIATVGMTVTGAAVLVLQATSMGRELFALEHGPAVAVVLVLITALGSVMDACLIVLRAQPILLAKSVISGVVKLAALPLLAPFGVRGLIGAYFLGALLSAVIGAVGIYRSTTVSRRRRAREVATVAGRAQFSAVNYVGTVLGILPATLLPIITAHVLGAENAAWMSISMMVASLLNVIPSASAQVLFAEVSRRRPLRECLTKAARLAFGLLTPAVAVLVPLAPFVLAMFGNDYRQHASVPLQLLAVAALPAAVNYLADSAVISTGRPGLYVALNGTNSALVLALTTMLAGHGTTGVATGWLLAQLLSMALCLGVLARLGVLPVRRRRQPHSPQDLSEAVEQPRKVLVTT